LRYLRKALHGVMLAGMLLAIGGLAGNTETARAHFPGYHLQDCAAFWRADPAINYFAQGHEHRCIWSMEVFLNELNYARGARGLPIWPPLSPDGRFTVVTGQAVAAWKSAFRLSRPGPTMHEVNMDEMAFQCVWRQYGITSHACY
jgi:hypothetical protein